MTQATHDIDLPVSQKKSSGTLQEDVPSTSGQGLRPKRMFVFKPQTVEERNLEN